LAATEPLSSDYRPVVLEFRILGPLEVVGEDGPFRLGGPRQRATLAILLLNAGRVVPVDDLAEELYAGAAPVTAVTQVQRQISELRKIIGAASPIETRPPGYVLRLAPEQLDLKRFERLAGEGSRALERGDPAQAVERLARALELWRGPPLADLALEEFAQTAIARLDEIRLAALELRLTAELALGRDANLVAELEELVAAHPLRERFRAQLMLALYRSGRQAEALDVYRAGRQALADEFGLEPTAALRELERAILQQDHSLDAARPEGADAPEEPESVVLAICGEPPSGALLAVAEALAETSSRELILARLVPGEPGLQSAAADLEALRASLSVSARTATFTSSDFAVDTVRLATTHDAAVVLLEAPEGLESAGVGDELGAILERSPAHIVLIAGTALDLAAGAGIFVPFGGGEHDWAALEIAASLGLAAGLPLRLVGRAADPQRGRRDASRLLADASLAVQRALGVSSTPLLAAPTEDALVAAVEPATAVVVGIAPGWRREGIGPTRRALVDRAGSPVFLVHRAPRPGALAPRDSRTRFTWSLQA
jgi:DNA-binding SARP family transcriptional activator